MPETGQYPEEIGYYEGDPYKQPPRTSVGGILGFHAARWMENRAETDIYREMSNLQGHMDNSYRLMNSSESPEEQQFHQEKIVYLREKYQQLLSYAQTGASGIRASAAVAETPGLLSDWEGVKEGYPAGFGVTIPLELTEPAIGYKPPSAVTPGTPTEVGTYEFPTTELGVTSPLASQEVSGYGPPSGQAYISPAAPGPELSQPITEGVPAGGYLGPPTGEFAANAGNYPADAYAARHGTASGGTTAGTTAGPFTGPDAGAGAGKYAPIETRMQYGRFRGFGNYPELMAAMEGTGRTGQPYERWEMRDMYDNQYSAADSLKAYLSEGYYGGMDNIQRVDLGQGIQDYRIRRDSMGNIRSYTPTGSRTQPWTPPYAPQY